ncbi:hypothetical protein CYMTET_35643 [Cymbomonas tetramitiformis]|uniref:Uncharacterized protein n=1 Tax=Cymbomonas tetramitiformis TaxID=36881 RepID=A0AAE0KNX0_9CHLO|nr:hypothetical protein CYMTET_35643 [Cymbomonas tetramitiformis]
MINGSKRVMTMYVEEFDSNFVVCSTLAEMALVSGNLDLFQWGVQRTMQAALLCGVETDARKRKRATGDNCKWGQWFDAVGYMTVVAARTGQTDALEWMLTGAYKEYFRDPFPEFCLCTEAADNEQWGTLRFLVKHGAKGLLCKQTQSVITGMVKRIFCDDNLNSAMLVLQDAFENFEIENLDRCNALSTDA